MEVPFVIKRIFYFLSAVNIIEDSQEAMSFANSPLAADVKW